MRPWPCLAEVPSGAVADELFAAVAQTPAVQLLQRRLEKGGALSCGGVSQAAQPFLCALLRHLYPRRPVVVVTAGLKTQETFQQDIETWWRWTAGQGPLENPLAVRKAQPPTHKPLFYPAWESLPHEAKLPHADIISERLETLVALAQSRTGRSQPAPLTVTSVVALLQRTFPPEDLRRRTRTLARGDRLDPLDLVEWLEEQGYEPEAQVTQKGELTLRGGIVDVFPPTSTWPVRLEFFGNELESFRYFDPLSQVSREQISSVMLPPAGELGVLNRQVPTSAGRGQSSTANPAVREARATSRSERLSTLTDYLPPETIFVLCEPEALAEQANQYAAQVPENDPFFVEWDNLQAELSAQAMTVLQVWEADAPGPGSEIAEAIDKEAPRPDAAAPATANLQPARLPLSSLDAFRPLGHRAPEPQIAEAQRREFFAQLHRWLRQDYAVHVYCNNDGERQRFNEIWEEYGLGNVGQASALRSSATEDGSRLPSRHAEKALSQKIQTAHVQPASGGGQEACPTLHLGALTRGFLFHDGKLVVVTDAEIFGRYKVQRPRRMKSPHAVGMRSALDIDFSELEEGDYVVHLQHGIGRYLGLKVLPMGAGRKRDSRAADAIGTAPPSACLPEDGPPHDLSQEGNSNGANRCLLLSWERPGLGRFTENPNVPAAPSPEARHGEGQECLVIEYAPADPQQPPPKLYVPVTEAHLVSKYVGAGKARPPLNTLGGTRWAKTKAQAERAVRDLAGELLSLQAARESQSGHAFAPDAPWQREFEGAFIYEETLDQMRAILETKVDMEKPKPMDRLICGDVGFGKTEVAIRAAFKAVMDGRQVAVLVPTTVLAQQHFNTFGERMADYPVRIELLSRFRTRRQQERVIQDLASGAVDIVIGTHRLVQEDVGFKDLGLVIIDEEQRFGVMQKEKFKLLRRLVDVLTLSATPIPRTLYLALTGARDMSTIETPPQDRLPVETIVTQYDERVIRDAVQRELNRGGQVFFLHNRS